MNKKIQMSLALAASVFALASFADGPTAGGGAGKGEGPCKQIKEACEKAGFVKGQAKQGSGLWVDCIRPIMQGTAQPQNATIKLPSVDSGLVTACKAKRPNFGEGHGKGKAGTR